MPPKADPAAFVVEPEYRVRFVREADAAALVNLYHLARTALSGGDDGKHARKCWAAAEFAKAHDYVSSTGAYKDLCGLLGH